MTEPDNALLARAYSLSGPGEAEKVYDEWAQTYDHDTIADMGYVAPRLAAERLADLVDAPASVLDAGCGTGLAGIELAKLTDLTIDGVDLSTGMLARARESGVYRQLTKADLTRPLDLAAASYDALLCVGTLTGGHVGPDALDEFVRVVRPGGHVVVTVQAMVWESGGYRAHLQHLHDSGVATLREAEERPYHEHEGITGYLCVLDVR
ncbi:class I SAM-dependent methyltransferase [Actinobacteria bacterium YIM 96077]|uniref:SAM-dependent methyltransferase n=1 Tax=Phytoactinopolyspora halophila TaxID=1981511 RepID=A0A329QJ87_9ACTN|nr:class I SAM-dependent methyltransferase [Phytoactinopolyspora halophila]AYY13554.1 class I SAM-dependent methyltransferase [Actinobacteria bacterium YIM 96077]RAW12390.1 SAM-dependent methyltransferase [Phytoactinopolyspora halophila]